MKRGTICTLTECNVKRGRKGIGEEVEVSLIETQYSGPSISDLPRDILLNILARLPVKRILVCKSVCKTWYNIISGPEFAKLLHDQAQVYPLIQRFRSRILYLMEPDKDVFELKLGMCGHTFSKDGCFCNVEVKIDTKFEITERWRMKDQRYRYNVVNSCNGLLCLYDPYSEYPPIVCNPITGEFINLPEAKRWGCYGFGFSPATNQYKVIRTFEACGANLGEVHILGTEKWKKIDLFTLSLPKVLPSYLNGFLYWFSFGKLSFFDVDKERFGSVSGPTGDESYVSESMGVLGAEVCIFSVLESGASHVWAMKDNGTEKSWSKVFSFDMSSRKTRYDCPFRPIKYLSNGALLLFYSDEEAFIYIDPSKNQFRYLKIQETKSEIEVIAYIPSFVSLKHALAGQNVEVLNVRSRRVEFKLHREAEEIDMVEEFDPDYDSDAKDIDIVEEFDFGFDSDLELDSEFDSDSSCDYA